MLKSMHDFKSVAVVEAQIDDRIGGRVFNCELNAIGNTFRGGDSKSARFHCSCESRSQRRVVIDETTAGTSTDGARPLRASAAVRALCASRMKSSSLVTYFSMSSMSQPRS